MSNKGFIISIVSIVVLVSVLAIIKYWADIKEFFDGRTNFQYVKDKGAEPFTTSSGQTGVKFGDYQFYSNDRAYHVPTKRLGTYTKSYIIWDDGTETLMSFVFKKK